MHDKDKTTHQHHPPFTMETYKQVKAGVKVQVHLSPKTVLHGVSGFLWGEGEPIPVIKFRDGSMVRVTENIIHTIQLEPLN